MKVTVDRIENNIAYLELPNGTMAKVDVIVLPDCAEGDVFRIEKLAGRHAILELPCMYSSK